MQVFVPNYDGFCFAFLCPAVVLIGIGSAFARMLIGEYLLALLPPLVVPETFTKSLAEHHHRKHHHRKHHHLRKSKANEMRTEAIEIARRRLIGV